MDSSKDPRCAYIANIAASMFGVPQIAQKIAQAPELTKFLNEISSKVFQIIFDPSQHEFKCLNNTVANPPA